MAAPLLLENLTWPDIVPLREKNGGLLLLPLGATTQHGPHLPISTDSLIVTKICHEISARTAVPVLPTLSYGVSQTQTSKWPGTFSLNYETLISALVDLADWASGTGWSRLLIVNGHAGNEASARIAIDQVATRQSGNFQIGGLSIYQLNPQIFQKFTGDAEKFHASRAETELMLHLHPELVMRDRLTEADDFDRTIGNVFTHSTAQTSFNGTTGFPSHASASAGRQLFEQICDALESAVKRAVTELPPLPPAEWERLHSPHRLH